MPLLAYTRKYDIIGSNMEGISHSPPNQLKFFFKEDPPAETAPGSKPAIPTDQLGLASKEEDPALSALRSLSNDPKIQKALERAEVERRQRKTSLTEEELGTFLPGEIPAYLLGKDSEPHRDNLSFQDRLF